MNRQQRTVAAVVLPPPVKSTTEKERKSNSFHRLFPLLLLTLYALASVVRLAFSSPFPSSFVQTSATSSSSSACNSIQDFQALLHEGYNAMAQSKPSLPAVESPPFLRPLVRSTRRELTGRCSRSLRPRIAVFVRKRCRVLVNLRELVRACQRTGFDVQIIEPKRDTPLDVIHRALVPADAMLAVHGAAMTHFLFMRPSSVLIQVVPLGLEKPAEEFYGEPARRLGMKYMAYNITPEESTLSKLYDRRNPILVNTNLITNRGWLEMKKIYLDKQNVKLNLTRFGKLLAKTYSHVCGARGIE